MEIILKNDIENLGYKDDVVTVKNGFARNYLIPKGLATLASPGAKRMLEENVKQRRHKEAKEIEDAQKQANELKELDLKLETKVGKGNKLFGSINNANLAEALSRKGYHIDRKYIQIQGGTVKALGPYSASIRLHREVIVDFEFEVVPES